MDATAFCSNHVWKRWFWPQKLSMNAPRFESAFWNAVYSKSAFWNAVYSKISMDATAFCSNHVWKRWFWPQKLSINAPLDGNKGQHTLLYYSTIQFSRQGEQYDNFFKFGSIYSLLWWQLEEMLMYQYLVCLFTFLKELAGDLLLTNPESVSIWIRHWIQRTFPLNLTKTFWL